MEIQESPNTIRTQSTYQTDSSESTPNTQNGGNPQITHDNHQASQQNNNNNCQNTQLFKVIGGSNNSKIFEIFNTQTQQSTKKVLKVINHKQLDSNRMQHVKECKDLYNEFMIMKKLDHPYIQKLYWYNNQHKFNCSITMPKIEQDLFKFQKQNQDLGEGNYLDIVKQIFYQQASALNYLHQNQITHNDIKLPNIFIEQKQGIVTYLADFGLAQDNSRQQEQQQQNLAEKQYEQWKTRCLYNLAPEMIQKIKNKDKETYVDQYKSDIFSLGLMIFNLTFKKNPFKGDCSLLDDNVYKNIVSKDYNKFWGFYSNKLQNFLYEYKDFQYGKKQVSYLMELLTFCLESDPTKRLSAADILKNEWFQEFKQQEK